MDRTILSIMRRVPSRVQRGAAAMLRQARAAAKPGGVGGLAWRRARIGAVHRLDSGGYDLIVLITTGIFQPFRLRTPFVHGQQAVDAWIAALVMGGCELGLIYPLAQQHRPFAHGTLIQNAQAVAATGEAARLDDAAGQLGQAALTLMHSVGYTEAMAQQVAALTRKLVVTARRIIAGTIRLHADLAPAAAAAPRHRGVQSDMIQSDRRRDQLPDGAEDLTPARAGGFGRRAGGRGQQGDRPPPGHQPPHGRDPPRPDALQAERGLAHRADSPDADHAQEPLGSSRSSRWGVRRIIPRWLNVS
jgi:hypothetical protein